MVVMICENTNIIIDNSHSETSIELFQTVCLFIIIESFNVYNIFKYVIEAYGEVIKFYNTLIINRYILLYRIFVFVAHRLYNYIFFIQYNGNMQVLLN